MYNTPEGIRGEILDRPKFQHYENDDANKFGLIVLRCINNAEAKLWEKYKNKAQLYEKLSDPIVLPAGVAFGANSEMYILDSTTTPILPADMYQLKKVTIVGDAGLKTDSKSTYDTDETEGTGIPADNTTIGASDVYHELVDEDDDIALHIVIGNTAAGASPDAVLLYVPGYAPTTVDTDPVFCPRGLFHSEFMPEVNSQLKLYVGQDGF